MKIINIDQGTLEWHKFRAHHLGATDASVIMELNPWNTRIDLWKTRIGITKSEEENEAMRKGKMYEPEARAWYEALKEESYNPCVVEHDKISYLSASLDGISVDKKKIVEVKCGAKTFAYAEQDVIFDYYWCQCQHQMMICDIEMMDFVSYSPERKQGVVIAVHRKDSFIKRIVKEEEIFWDCVMNFKAPKSLDKIWVEVK